MTTASVKVSTERHGLKGIEFSATGDRINTTLIAHSRISSINRVAAVRVRLCTNYSYAFSIARV